MVVHPVLSKLDFIELIMHVIQQIHHASDITAQLRRPRTESVRHISLRHTMYYQC